HLVFFFFLIIPPPPSSTLFPYTTLFRSDAADSPAHARAQTLLELLDEVELDVVAPLAREAVDRIPITELLESLRHDHQRFLGDVDRKSTGLNSSHVAISYAVFCLKKKKT